MNKLRLVEAVEIGNVTYINPGEAVQRVDLWKRGGFRGSSLFLGRIPISENGVDDERFIEGLTFLGLIEERSWIPVRDGDLLSIVDTDTDIEEYQCRFERFSPEKGSEKG